MKKGKPEYAGEEVQEEAGGIVTEGALRLGAQEARRVDEQRCEDGSEAPLLSPEGDALGLA